MRLFNKIFLIILIIASFAAQSCREEIISPGNPAGNINEPVFESYIDFYTFKINASNATLSLTDYTYFNANINYLSFSVLDHSGGSADLMLWTKNNLKIYDTRLSKDFSRTTVIIDGNIPQLIQIKLNNFSGKVSIQLSRY